MKSDQLYIDQIKDSIRKAESYIQGLNKEEFLTDEKTQSAVILQLTLIGELSNKISDETKSKFNIPWRQIIDFRNRAIHNYFEVDLNIVWDTLQGDIPVLKSELKKDL